MQGNWAQVQCRVGREAALQGEQWEKVLNIMLVTGTVLYSSFEKIFFLPFL